MEKDLRTFHSMTGLSDCCSFEIVRNITVIKLKKNAAPTPWSSKGTSNCTGAGNLTFHAMLIETGHRY
jgi:hypothetical protein